MTLNYFCPRRKTGRANQKNIFMTQTIDLNKMGLSPMSNFEMQEVDGGGGLWDFLIGYFAGKVLDAIPGGLKAMIEYDKTHPNTVYNYNGSANWR
jgi:hypothetical protein